MDLMLAPAVGGADTASPRKANQRDTRHHNLRLVLGTLYREGELSRADIVRRTLLTKVAVSDLVAELLGQGVVEEVGRRSATGRGKPATYLRVKAGGRSIVAVDLSDTDRLRWALVDLNGGVQQRGQRTLSEAPTVEEAVAVVTEVVACASAPVLGVAVGTPGTVGADGMVHHAPLLGWTTTPLGDLLTASLGLPVVVENDANAAAVAERTYGGGSDDMVLVQVARGVGAAVLVGGEVVRGASASAGEIGHVVVDPEGLECGCGKRGCLETLVSGRALADRAGESRQHRRARQAAAGAHLGATLAPVVAILDVPEVVVAGDPGVVDDEFLAAAHAAIRARTDSAFRRDVIIRRSTTGPDAVLRGVSALLLRERLAAF